MNGWEIETPEPAVVDVMLRVADGRMDRDGLAAWLRSVLVPFVD
ncbi:MAG: cell filamentation protein Fic [Gemmatimonadota bacterium]